MKKPKIALSGVLALFLVLISGVIGGCYQPLRVSSPRVSMGVGVGSGLIFFAGGFYNNGTASSIVDILDPSTGEYLPNLELSSARAQIAISSVGSKVLFAGGKLYFSGHDGYNKIDIYDTQTQVMQTVDFIVPFPNFNIKSLVVGSRVLLYSPASTFVLIVDPISNTMESLPLSIRPRGVATGDSRVFFVGMLQNSLRFDILNLSNMAWNDPVEFAWNTNTNNEILGLVYYPTSLAVVGPTIIHNIDVNNPNRQIYQATFSDRRVAAFNLIDEELYLIGPGFITIYRPFARLLQIRSSLLFFHSAHSAEYNGTIYYTTKRYSNIFNERVLQLDTRVLLNTFQFTSDNSAQVTGRELYAAHGFVFGILGRFGRIYSHNLITGQTDWYNYPGGSFIFSEYGVVQARRKVFLFSSRDAEDSLVFDANTSTWSVYAAPELIGASSFPPISTDDYIVRRNATDVVVIDVAANEWSRFPVDRNHPIHLVQDHVVVFERMKVRIFDIKAREWNDILNVDQPVIYDLIAVHNSTVIVRAVGSEVDSSEIHFFNVRTREDRVERFSAQIGMTSLVHNDEVILVGGTRVAGGSDLSGRVDIYNVKTATWRHVILPPNMSFYVPPRIVMAARDTHVFVSRENRVDMIDLESLSVTTLLVAQADPISVQVIGSKVVFFSARVVGRVVSIYETTTGTSFSFTFDGADRNFRTTENFVIVLTFGDVIKVMELPTIMNQLNDVQRFIGQDVDFEVDVKGKVIDTYWQRNAAVLPNESTFNLLLRDVTQAASGTYAIQLVDQCSQRMTEHATLVVHGSPVITDPLEESLVLCHQSARISVEAKGEQMMFNWTYGSEPITTSNQSIVLSGDQFECNSRYQLCVTASNPAGATQTCSTIIVLDHDLVFDGPRPVTSLPVWLSGSEVTLTVRLLHEDCTEHEWFMNGVPMDVEGPDTSTVQVTIEPLIATAAFSVVAQCGSSRLESIPYKFTSVSSWTVGGVVAFVIPGTIGVTVLALVGFFVRRRMVASQLHEVELEHMLTQAKSETLNLEGAVPIVQATTWEWSPGEGFTYKPIDKMPFAIDYSALTALGKESVRVGVWNQSIIEVTLRDQKAVSSKGGLRERLVAGTTIDVYAPQSPKYEIKVEPSSVELDTRAVTYMTISTTMRMTANCKVCLIVVSERDKIYSVIEFKMSSGMSTWIDLDEVESNGEYLGGGGFGSVTLGTYRGQEVAVKKLLSQYLTDEMKIEFEREVTLMKDLRHPNIVQFVGASNVKNSLAIVIEFAPLGSIASIMEKQKLTNAMKVTMLLETAKALQFLHTNGIIHRDIKPQNILVFSVEPRAPVHVKLTDFGTARFISDDATTITKNIGTIAFMAPEALGKNPRIKKSADVYSFAVLTWSMMCEQTPFREFKWDSDIESHVKNGQRLPFPEDGSISPAVIKLVEECWQHEPAQRPSMASVVQRLAALTNQ